VANFPFAAFSSKKKSAEYSLFKSPFYFILKNLTKLPCFHTLFQASSQDFFIFLKKDFNKLINNNNNRFLLS